MVWYSHFFQNFPQFIVIHTVKGFGRVNKAEIDVFLELSCFFDDPAHHCWQFDLCSNQNYNEVSPHISQNGHHQKNLQTVKAGQSVERRECSYTVGENINWCNH